MDMPRDTRSFMMRWRRKSLHYGFDRLIDCFDGFFSAYVLYNFLYDYFCELSPDKYSKRDGDRAIEAVLDFLGSDNLADDGELKGAVATLVDELEDGTFYLRNQRMDPKGEWNAARIKGLRSPIHSEWSKCLLEVIYRIRNNT